VVLFITPIHSVSIKPLFFLGIPPGQAWGSGAPPSSLFAAARKAITGNDTKKTTTTKTTTTPPPPPPTGSRASGGRGGGDNPLGRGTPGRHNNRKKTNNNSHNNNSSNTNTGGRGGGHNNNNNNNNNNKGRNNHQGGRGGRGRGRGDKHGGGGGKVSRFEGITPWDEIVLFNTRGSGDADAERAIQRRSMAAFLSCRMNYLDPLPEGRWTPHERCLWKDGKDGPRVEQIEAQMKVLWDFKPLQVNDETRWKARSIEGAPGAVEETNEEKIRKATGILNKLSWTTLDKLTVRFLETIGSKNTDGGEAVLSKEIVEMSMHLVLDKAMMEPHFAELYASLCSKLAKVHKSFKKTLLAQCQAQFEENDREESLENLPEDPAERDYELGILRKKYVGLMQFIGELYKNQVIKGAIMINCLERLFLRSDEEKLECFAKLMTTIGERLHTHEDEPEMHKLWDHVYSMADRASPDGRKVADDLQAPNTRIKFIMQDLIDLKESGWVQRRPVLKAKKISDIHAEVAKEEAAAAMASRRPSKANMARSQSGGSLRSSSKFPSSNSLSSHGSNLPPPPPPSDSEGFTPVPKPKKGNVRRVQSEGGPPGTSSLQRAVAGNDGNKVPRNNGASTQQAPKAKQYPTPEECAEKIKSILKEHWVGGDTADAVLSIDELVGIGQDGDEARGKSIIEAAVLTMMEAKESEVETVLKLFEAAAEKIPDGSFVKGLTDPVEYLRDIEIDAPLASHLLAMIMANWFTNKYLPSMTKFFVDNDDLKDFRDRADETRAAEFCRQVIKKRGGDLTEDDLEAVAHLMTDEERLMHPDVRSWIEQI